SMARAKFVAKMLTGRRRVLEVGCGDAFCAPIVKQTVEHLTVSDFDPAYVEDARARMTERWPYDAIVLDVTHDTPPGRYDGIYSLDMLEHIPATEEEAVLERLTSVLEPVGALIIGMPSIESQVYASSASRAGHVNCKSEQELRELMEQFFHNVFLFGMNDEVLHTGYGPMCHYRLALACTPRSL
ncbi:MAG TPA: class I SAM-dependent methyltransferase, partial [Acidimicrobiales bacterium]|nr:class I SAM-dependent methyltransferase [Acidimicrobiales bacterium]